MELFNADIIVKDVFVTLQINNLRALTCDKEGDLRNHFFQNLDFAMLSKNFSWLSNLVLTIPVKLSSQLVIGIIDTGSSSAARSVFLETQWVSGLCGGASWTINGKALWPQFLLDFGLALLFRLVFQYLNVAPMTGN